MFTSWDVFLPTPLFLAKSLHARTNSEDDARVYGASPNEKTLPEGVVVLSIVLILATIAIFWLWPLLKAFQCGSGATGLGLSGNIWGLLILFQPYLGWIFLFFGGKCTPA